MNPNDARQNAPGNCEAQHVASRASTRIPHSLGLHSAQRLLCFSSSLASRHRGSTALSHQQHCVGIAREAQETMGPSTRLDAGGTAGDSRVLNSHRSPQRDPHRVTTSNASRPALDPQRRRLHQGGDIGCHAAPRFFLGGQNGPISSLARTPGPAQDPSSRRRRKKGEIH